MGALLEVRNLVVEYVTGGYPVRPIDGLDLTGEAGELIVLLGPSGCGKTSLLSVLGGILTPTSGSVRVADREVTSLSRDELTRYRRGQVGIVFQAFNLVPSLSARENVAAPLLLHGVTHSSAMARADIVLAKVGLTEHARRRPGRLSGGQQQRVAVARALATDAPVLLADEPTANLDYVHAQSIVELLRELRSDGRLIVISTHDDRLIPIADRVIHMAPEFRGDQQPPHEVTYESGSLVFEQGERGELVYVVLEGTVEITQQASEGELVRLATLGPGDYFGELGPLLGFPRSATARAATDVRLRAMGVIDFRREVQDRPGVPR